MNAGCLPGRTSTRVFLTHSKPFPIAGQVQAPGNQIIDGVAEKKLGEGILVAGGVVEVPDSFISQGKELLAAELFLVILYLLIQPLAVELAL